MARYVIRPHDGRTVVERYAAGQDAGTQNPDWFCVWSDV